MIATGGNAANGTGIVARSGKKKRAVQPLRSHRLFVPGVALWFAALFGLASLAVRTALIEAVVQALQVHLLIPAAAPPLGTTARVLIACGMTLLGAVIGFVVATVAARSVRPKVAPAEAPAAAAAPFSPELPTFRKRDLHPDAPVRAPVQALDEFGERLDGPSLDGPSLDDGALDAPVAEASLGDALILETSNTPEAAPPPAPASVVIDHVPAALQPAPSPALAPAPYVPLLSSGAQRIAAAALDDLSNLELIERLAIAMQRRAEAEGFGDEAAATPSRALRGEDLTPRLRALAEKRPQDTERALRGALAALQRVSGAA